MKTLSEAIYYRKSHRAYKDEELSAEILGEIKNFVDTLPSLCPDIKTKIVLHTERDFLITRPWAPRYALSLYSEKKDGYLENAGFLLQEMDLFLQSKGLGACWLGLSKPNEEAYKDEFSFVILLCFGVSDTTMRKDLSEFVRKSLSEISDVPDEKLEPARLAPSARNTQPWYFTQENGVYHLFRSKPFYEQGIDYLSQIDAGIALAHLFVANEKSFSFLGKLPELSREDNVYVGSFRL